MFNTLGNVLFLSIFGVVLYFVLNNLADRLIAWRLRRLRQRQNPEDVSTNANNTPSPSFNKSSSPPPQVAIRPDEKKKTPISNKVLGVESVAPQAGKNTGRGRS